VKLRARSSGLSPPDPSIRDEVFMAVPLTAYDPAIRGRVVSPPAYAAG